MMIVLSKNTSNSFILKLPTLSNTAETYTFYYTDDQSLNTGSTILTPSSAYTNWQDFTWVEGTGSTGATELNGFNYTVEIKETISGRILSVQKMKVISNTTEYKYLTNDNEYVYNP